jgi:MbtH protein
MEGTEDKSTYKVVVNHEEQYSIWPADRANAPGWRDDGKTGDKSECLAYIKTVWTEHEATELAEENGGSKRPRQCRVTVERPELNATNAE